MYSDMSTNENVLFTGSLQGAEHELSEVTADEMKDNHYSFEDNLDDMVVVQRETPESENESSVLSQLAEKERYLVLAAEAGNELLAKNRELRRQYDRLKEEHTEMIEELHQEKFTLRREIFQREEVHESKIQEMHNDIDAMRVKLASVDQASHKIQKFYKDQLEEMGEQNEFLSSQLDQVKTHNRDLSFQVNTLRKRIESRSRQAMDSEYRDEGNEDGSVRFLREQVAQLQQKQRHLEEHITECIEEKDIAVADREAARAKVLALDQEVTELKQRVSLYQEELEQSKWSNSLLKEQLEDYMLQASMSMSRRTNNSLFDELELTLSESDLSILSKYQESTPLAAFHPRGASSQNDLREIKRRKIILADDVEDKSDDEEEQEEEREIIINDEIIPINGNSSSNDKDNTDKQNPFKNRTEFHNCYKKLSRLYNELCDHIEDSTSQCTYFPYDKSLYNTDNTTGHLEEVVDQVYGLIQKSLIHRGYQHQDVAKVTNLKQKLNEARQEVATLKKEIIIYKGMVRKKEDELESLNQKVRHQGREIVNLTQEKELLLSNSSIEDTVKKAILDRQEAFQRENKSISELEQMRADMKKLNDQLVDAIQQKIELTEQLDRWQIDMAALIQKQLSSNASGDPKKVKRRSFFNTRWSWGAPRIVTSKESQ